MANKVEFGICKLHVGTFDEVDGVVTLGTPYHQAGAVSFAPEAQSNANEFYADDELYFNEYLDGKIEGDLNVAMFDDAFKQQFMGYKYLESGGLANIKNGDKKAVYVAFELKGDREKRRVIFYNGRLGAISKQYNTTTESNTPDTETLPISFAGVSHNGVCMATFRPTDAGYDTLFTNPTAPEIADESE